MLEQIRQWIKPPIFPDDEDKTRDAQILYALLANMLLFLVFAMFGTIFIFVQKIGASIFILGLFIWVLIIGSQVQRGRVLAASKLFIAGLWIGFALLILRTGRINTTFVSLHVALTVITGILLGKRSAIILTLLSIIFGLGFTILECTGYPLVQHFPAPPLAGWVVWVLAFILTLTPLNPVVQDAARSAETIQESETRFRSIYSQSPFAIELYDAEGFLTDANPACLNLFGVTNADAMKGFKLFDNPNVPEDAKQQLLAGKAVNYQAVFDFELVKELNLYQTTKSGRCYLDCFITPWTTGKDVPSGYLVHSRDITERKQMEMALIESQIKFSAIFTNSLDSILVSKAGVFVMVNPAFLRMHGYKELSELVGHSVLDLVAPESREMIAENIRRRASGQPTPTFYEALVLQRDGTKFWVELSISTYEIDGETYTLAVERDITERKEVEEKLRESEERFRTFIEQSVDGFMLADEQGTIIAWNQALARITGLPREQALGMTMWDIQYQIAVPEKRAGLSLDQLRNALQTMQSGESPFFGQANDAEIQTVHGERKFIQQTSFPIHTAQGTRIGAVVRDVTERKQMEIALLENEKKYRDLFEHVPVALWNEDFSSLKTHLDKLRKSGVTDLHAYFEQHPQDVAHCAELIKVIDVNQATLSLFETETKKQLLGNLKRIFRYQSPTIIKEEISTLYGGETPYQGEMVAVSLNGNSFHCHIEVAIPPGYEETWDKVFVSVTDITERKQMEEREHEQRALAEAISNSAAALNSTLNFNDVLDHIIDNVGRVVPHDAANIMLLDVHNEKLSLVCHRGYAERGAKNSEIEQQFSLDTLPILIEAARTGQPLTIPDTHANPAWTSFPATEWVNSYLTVPIQIRKTTVGFLNLDSETIGFFNPDHAERLQAFANHAAIAINNAQLYEDMKIVAVTDALTGIYNRAFFETELARIELGRDFPVSIIVADLDNLKTINDTLGHTAGDKLIKNTAKILQNAFRAADIIARIGGDEFSVLLPNTDSGTAEQMLSRVRTKIVEHNTAYPDIPVQLSLGTATAEPEQGQLMEVFTLADQRMYADKARRKSSR